MPKWVPGDDYCTLLERVEACGRDDLFVQTVKCRGSCERGPNAIALDDNTEEEIELEEMCLETGGSRCSACGAGRAWTTSSPRPRPTATRGDDVVFLCNAVAVVYIL